MHDDQAIDTQIPLTSAGLLRKQRALRKKFLSKGKLLPVRIAILGGSTTVEVKTALELFLLSYGIQPSFFESSYSRYHEDVLFENPELMSFRPDVVFIHTTWRNVTRWPQLMDSDQTVSQCVDEEISKFAALWEGISSKFNAVIIQNNFDLPLLRPLGNLESTESYGNLNFLMRLNAAFATYAREHSHIQINDIHYLSAKVGLDAWHNPLYWYNFHMAVSPDATVILARNVAGIVRSLYGRSKKCLVLDLDNTLWGGVIGDDGLEGLVLGRDNPSGEAFLDFQRYVKKLKERGVILAVCSKNDLANAKEGFSHPDSLLKLDDFSAFKANWDSKAANIREIAQELNIGLDSIVFVDDNPAERALLREELADVATPEIGSDVSRFAERIEAEGYFDVHRIVPDDLKRSAYYQSNAEREIQKSNFTDYGAFLESLEMTADIAPFSPIYLDRITQLINKTNQFNLTTRRYSGAEVENIAGGREFVTLYGRLTDRFGDNGLVSVIIGREAEAALILDVWLMSCRVLNREMELAMFDALIEECQARGIEKIVGVYIPSKKNGMVADHYPKLGFVSLEGGADGQQSWAFAVPKLQQPPRTKHIRRAGRPEHVDSALPREAIAVSDAH